MRAQFPKRRLFPEAPQDSVNLEEAKDDKPPSGKKSRRRSSVPQAILRPLIRPHVDPK